MSAAGSLHHSVVEDGRVSVAVSVLLSTAVGIAVVSIVVV